MPDLATKFCFRPLLRFGLRTNLSDCVFNTNDYPSFSNWYQTVSITASDSTTRCRLSRSRVRLTTYDSLPLWSQLIFLSSEHMVMKNPLLKSWISTHQQAVGCRELWDRWKRQIIRHTSLVRVNGNHTFQIDYSLLCEMLLDQRSIILCSVNCCLSKDRLFVALLIVACPKIDLKMVILKRTI